MRAFLFVFHFYILTTTQSFAQTSEFALQGRGIRSEATGQVMGMFSDGIKMEWRIYSAEGELIRMSENPSEVIWDPQISSEENMRIATEKMSGEFDAYLREIKRCMHRAKVFSFSNNLVRLVKQYEKVAYEFQENYADYPLIRKLVGYRIIGPYRMHRDYDHLGHIEIGSILELIYSHGKVMNGSFEIERKAFIEKERWNWSVEPLTVKSKIFIRLIYQLLIAEEIQKIIEAKK
jgi:hypothetical protein